MNHRHRTTHSPSITTALRLVHCQPQKPVRQRQTGDQVSPSHQRQTHITSLINYWKINSTHNILHITTSFIKIWDIYERFLGNIDFVVPFEYADMEIYTSMVQGPYLKGAETAKQHVTHMESPKRKPKSTKKNPKWNTYVRGSVFLHSVYVSCFYMVFMLGVLHYVCAMCSYMMFSHHVFTSCFCTVLPEIYRLGTTIISPTRSD